MSLMQKVLGVGATIALVLGGSGKLNAVEYYFDNGNSFADYPIGTLVNDLDNWQSSDTITGHGWEVTGSEGWHDISFGEDMSRQTWSKSSNYATFYFKGDKPIKGISINCQYSTGHSWSNGNCSLLVDMSGDNSNWSSLKNIAPNSYGAWAGTYNPQFLSDRGIEDSFYMRFSSERPNLIGNFVPTKVHRLEVTVETIPEPATLGLLTLGAGAVALGKRKKK